MKLTTKKNICKENDRNSKQMRETTQKLKGVVFEWVCGFLFFVGLIVRGVGIGFTTPRFYSFVGMGGGIGEVGGEGVGRGDCKGGWVINRAIV